MTNSVRVEPAVEPRWEQLETDDGILVRAQGPTLDSAFEEAARALNGLVTKPERVRPHQVLSFELRATKVEDLLTAWLETVAMEMIRQRLVFGRFLVRLDGNHLTARAWGEHVDHWRHGSRSLVRACSLGNASASQDETGAWRLSYRVEMVRGRPSIVPPGH